jgi:hypothetical protein
MTKHGPWQRWLYGREAEKDSLLRLEAKLASYEIQHRARAKANTGPWADTVTELLAKAKSAKHADEGWECFQTALRAAVDGMTPAEVWAEGSMLRPEAREKLKNWRRDAAMDLLEGGHAQARNSEHIAAIATAVAGGEVASAEITKELMDGRDIDETTRRITTLLVNGNHNGAGDTAAALVALFHHEMAFERVALQGALLVRDDNAMNGHQRTRMFRAQIVSLMCVVALLVIALVLVVIAFPLSADASVANEGLWVYGFLLGGIGGALSALQRTTARSTRGRIPELREFKVWMWSLPLAGGAAGLAAVPLALAGVIPVKDNVQTVLAAAFVAGFSERLIVRAASTLTSDTGKPAA